MDRVGLPSNTAQERLAILALAMSMMLASLGASIANVALPTISEALSAPFHAVQWIVTGYLVALTVSVVFVGRLGDRFGLKRMLLGGLALFVAASLLCGIAPTLMTLVAARVLQGAAAAFLTTLSIALVQQTAGAGRTGRAMGLIGAMSALGTALGPTLGGFLIPATGWSGVFLIMVPLGVLALMLTQVFLPGDTVQPALPRIALRDFFADRLVPRLMSNLLVAAVMMATLVIGPFYLSVALGLSTARVGVVMSVGPVIALFCGIPAGRLVDAFGSERVILIGLLMLMTGAFSLALLPVRFGVAGYVMANAILTPGYQLFLAANNTAVMESVTPDRRGVISGLLGLSRNLGLVLGASGLGAIFAFAIGSGGVEEAAPNAITFGMQCVFVLAGLSILVTTVLVGRNGYTSLQD